MRMQEIQRLAREKGVKPGHIPKAELIRTIQRSEGHTGCFGLAAQGECPHFQCLWREDCLWHSVQPEKS